MRRFLSIAALAALLSSMASPVMMACMGAGKAAPCHAAAAAVPHCDRPMMHHHHDEEQAQAEQTTRSGVSAGNSDDKCPMDCCTHGHRQSGVALAAASFSPLLAVTDQSSHGADTVFLSAGFSSHTDRGPPLA